MKLALSPSRLLERGQGNTRQSRPVYVWITAGLTRALAPLARRTGLAALYGVEHPAYLPSIVLNWCLLTAGLFLLWRFLRDLGGPLVRYAALLCAVVFLGNDVVKAFFWSPHMQMFNLMVPVVGLVICRSILAGPTFSFPKTLLVGSGLGLLSLAYENPIFLLPALGAAFVLRARPVNAQGWSREAFRSALLAVGFALPHLLWMTFGMLTRGDYTNVAVGQDRNFIWILDSLRAGMGELFERGFSYSLLFARTVFRACGLLVVCGVLLVFARLGLGARLTSSTPARHHALTAAVLTFLSASTFLYLMGEYVERICFFLGPVFLVICGLWLTEVLERSSRRSRVFIYGGLAGLTAVWFLYQVGKHGPYS